jgi:hypothetical protein
MLRARLYSFLAWAFVTLWSRTINVRIVNRDIRDRLEAEGKQCIYTFWHGSLFLMLHAHRKAGVTILASESRDGEIMAQLLRRFGFEVVRGSTKRNGHRALLALASCLRRGRSVAIAVDGPRGPAREVKPGTLFLAGKLNVPIVPIVVSAKHAAVLEGTWDKLMVPAPFTRGVIVYGDPIVVDGASDEAIESGRAKLIAAMRRLTLEAQERADVAEREPHGRFWERVRGR